VTSLPFAALGVLLALRESEKQAQRANILAASRVGLELTGKVRLVGTHTGHLPFDEAG
jgi:hypothetical protein